MDAENIFFSYSRVDSDFTIQLANKLVEAELNIWLDKFNIEAGEKWDNEIQKALESSNTLLVILSKSSIKSENVMDEVSYAIGKGKKVIPVLIEECEIPFRIRRLQYANFTRTYEEGLKTLTDALELDNNRRAKLLGQDQGNIPVYKRKESVQKISKQKKILLLGGSILLIAVVVWATMFRTTGKTLTANSSSENYLPNNESTKQAGLLIPPINFNVTEGTTLIYHSETLARKDTFRVSSSETLENLMTALINHYKITAPKDLKDEYASEKGGYRLKETLWKNNLPVNNYSSTLKEGGVKDFDLLEFKYELTNSRAMACPPSSVSIRIDGLDSKKTTLYLNGSHVSQSQVSKGHSTYFYFEFVGECNPDSWYCELSYDNKNIYMTNPTILNNSSDTTFLQFKLPAKTQ
jgi:hypothetical protein